MLQINLGRGREATEVVKKVETELEIDVLCISEPYHNFGVWNEIGDFLAVEGGKAGIVIVQDKCSTRMLREVSDTNSVYVEVKRNKGKVVIGSVYAEKHGNL